MRFNFSCRLFLWYPFRGGFDIVMLVISPVSFSRFHIVRSGTFTPVDLDVLKNTHTHTRTHSFFLGVATPEHLVHCRSQTVCVYFSTLEHKRSTHLSAASYVACKRNLNYFYVYNRLQYLPRELAVETNNQRNVKLIETTNASYRANTEVIVVNCRFHTVNMSKVP